MVVRPNLPDPYVWIDREEALRMEQELYREVSSGHPLAGRRVTALARSVARDDVIFEVEHEPGAVVLVHLTWRGGSEPPPWPRSVQFASLDAFLADLPSESS